MKATLLLIFMALLASCHADRTRWVKPEYDEDMHIIKHQEGSITYLIFGNGNGLQVKNYTSDSLEYEFLHSPTKTRDK